jgi:hypothetical protein
MPLDVRRASASPARNPLPDLQVLEKTLSEKSQPNRVGMMFDRSQYCGILSITFRLFSYSRQLREA